MRISSNEKSPVAKSKASPQPYFPIAQDGKVAVDEFQKHLVATQNAGLQNAVNMDTGYVNYLSDSEKLDVLRWTREALGPTTPFVAGAYIEHDPGDDIAALYRRQMDAVTKHGGTPILFQTRRLHGKSNAEKAAVYSAASKGHAAVLAFELGQMFAPNGEIFDDDMIRRLLDIPEIKGMKHSSLDRLIELKRLDARDRIRPDFRIYTGNDLGIDMIEYGSDYLLGLATFAPEKFAERDRLWASRRCRLLRPLRRPPIPRQRRLPRPRPRLQTLRRRLPPNHQTHLHSSHAPAKPHPPPLGTRHNARLRPSPLPLAQASSCRGAPRTCRGAGLLRPSLPGRNPLPNLFFPSSAQPAPRRSALGCRTLSFQRVRVFPNTSQPDP